MVDVAQAAAACHYELTPSTVNVDEKSHDASFRLNATDGCSWSVRSDAAWIGDVSPASGVGSATITFTVGANTGRARDGSLTVANATVHVTQGAAPAPEPPPPTPIPQPPPSPAPTPSPTPTPTPTPTCSYRLGQTTRTVSRDGEEFTVTMTAPAGCAWTVSGDTTWIAVTDGRSGSGDGGIRLAVAANTGAARTATVRVATETLTVQQSGAPACSYSIKPTYYNAGKGPDDILVNVTTTDSSCGWTASTNASWVTIDSGRTGTGNGTVHLVIPANAGAPRSATVTIAGNPLTLTQEGACVATIKPRSYESGRGPDNILIAVTIDASCPWTATSTASWVTVAEGATGTGNGTVRLLVQPNTGAVRSVTLTIAGQPFDLRQLGPQ
jgi:hypothetical protein